MYRTIRATLRLAISALLLAIAVSAPAQQFDPAYYRAMKWRQIGPFRGGRVLAVSGIPGDPLTFYFGGTGSGVWKTTNGGQDWLPLFDRQAVSAVGAIAVAPSDPGVFVSFDDGEHWQPLQMNLPTTPIHDLIVKDNDLSVVTHGRSFWVLDDLSPLRQIRSAASTSELFHLYTPALAYRDRWGSGRAADLR